MNRIDPNDPRLTAYALGELDEAERAEFQKLLEESEEDLSLVAEYRNLAEILTQELACEPHPILTPAQRGVIEQRFTNTNGKTRPWFKGWTWFFQPYQLAGALATCLVLGLGYLFLQSNVPLSRHLDKMETMNKMEVATGVSTEKEQIETISSLQSEQPQVATERFARGKEVKPQQTLTESIAGRPLVETGDQVAAVPETVPAPLFVPQPEAVRVVVARADKAAEPVQLGVTVATETGEPERPNVVELPAPQPPPPAVLAPPAVPAQPASPPIVSTQPSDAFFATGQTERVASSSGTQPAPSKPETAGAAETTTFFDRNADEMDGDGSMLAESTHPQLSWSDKSAASEEKLAIAEPSSSLSMPSSVGGETSSRSRRSHRVAGETEDKDQVLARQIKQHQPENSNGLVTHEYSWVRSSPIPNAPLAPTSSSQGGAFGKHPEPSADGKIEVNAQIQPGMAGSGGMMGGMGMMRGADLQQQVAAGGDRRFGGAAAVERFAYQPADKLVAAGQLIAMGEKPEVIIPTESEGVETYSGVVDNPFKSAADEPLSTFSIDVDTASYSNLRRYLNQGSLPPKDAVRIEELLNYFPYDYAPPTGEEPFATHAEVSECPWNTPHRLVRIGIKGKVPPSGDRPACNLVFLIDVSGSMQPENKLPLLKKAMTLLLNQLQPTDQVAIVTYAGSTSLVLPSTPCSNKSAIQAAIDNLQSGGSTNGEGGIQLAYKTAEQTLLKNGINRVILATDGDFNVGITSREELEKIITDKAKGGVFLSVLGFGMGNLKDATLETLADKGNGNYAYIDTLQEARKVLVEQMSGTLMTIAKDVKIQIEFNPGRTGAYRLIGYENRVMAAQDFNDDRKDAGEIGAGHTVTALYEVVPVGTPINMAGVDPLKYQKPAAQPAMTNVDSPEMMTVKLRYKAPDGDTSKLIEVPVIDPGPRLDGVTPDFKFAAAVASFGMLVRESPYRGKATFDTVLALAQEGKGADKEGYRTEFIQLVGLAKALKP